MKYFGQHSCLPVKPIREREIADAVKEHLAKGFSVLFNVVGRKREFSEVENKADQMLDRFILIKTSTTSKGNSDFSKLIELKER